MNFVQYLSSIDPSLPAAVLALWIFALVYLVRKFFPQHWELVANVIPVKVDSGMAMVTLRKLWQAIPAALLGATIPVLLTGGDVKLAASGALVGLVPPFAHEIAKWIPWIPYRGEVGKPSKAVGQ